MSAQPTEAGPVIRPRPIVSADLERILAAWALTMRGEGLAERTIIERPAFIRRLAVAMGDPVTLKTEQLLAYIGRAGAARTRSTYYAMLKGWFRFLILTGRRDDDPTTLMRPPRVPRGVPHPITDGELERLLRGSMHARTRAMILLAAYQGLRVHEIAKVRGEDFDLASAHMRVTGKGGVTALVPLHPRVVALAGRMPSRGWWFPAWKDNAGARAGQGPILGRSVSTIVALTMRRAGIDASAHSLRHWYGTNALRAAGGNLRVAQEMLRHASPATTAIYTRVDTAERAAAMAAMPDLG